jgi:transporter family-2 protein
MTLLPLLLAMLIGAALPVQAGVNSQLRVGLGHPMLAATVSFVVGAVALGAVALAQRAPIPGGAVLARLPWWVWGGGLLGALYVVGSILLVPRLGAATLTASIVAGQLAAALLLDQFGLVGYARHPLTLARLLGAVLLLAGVVLIQRR